MISCCRHDEAVGTLLNSVFSDNDCAGSVELYGLNLFSQGVAGRTFTGNGLSSFGSVAVGTIGLLQADGGPTLTNALRAAGSAAIDSTAPQSWIDENLTALTTDQCGAPRIVGARCDVGAFDYGCVVPILDHIFLDGFDDGT